MKRVVVRTAWNEADAQIVVGRLPSLGIDASMEGGMLAATAFDAALASRGGIQVLVPEDQVEQASAELRRIARHEPDDTRTAPSDADVSDVEAGFVAPDPADDALEVAREETAFQAQRVRSNRRRRFALGCFIAPVVIALVSGLIAGIVMMIREYLR